MSVLDLVRTDLRGMQAYSAAEQVGDSVRLNANESPYRDDLGRYERPLNRYPEIRPQRLTRALAQWFDCDPNELLVTRGSSEAIDLLIRVFCRANEDAVVVSPPAFSMYAHYARVQGAELRRVPLVEARDFVFEAQPIIDACDDDVRLIFICSPNNPTGGLAPIEEIRMLASARKDRSVIVVDEAYLEFADCPSARTLASELDNIVVLRTLSKALGLAGVRCGSVIAQRELIELLSAVQPPYSVATPVVETALHALRAESLRSAMSRIDAIRDERERVTRKLAKMPQILHVYPSAANFALVRFADLTAALNACKAANILIRDVSSEVADCARITIGTRTENDTLLTVLAGAQEARA